MLHFSFAHIHEQRIQSIKLNAKSKNQHNKNCAINKQRDFLNVKARMLNFTCARSKVHVSKYSCKQQLIRSTSLKNSFGLLLVRSSVSSHTSFFVLVVCDRFWCALFVAYGMWRLGRCSLSLCFGCAFFCSFYRDLKHSKKRSRASPSMLIDRCVHTQLWMCVLVL